MSRFYPNLFSVFNTFGELFYKKGSFPPISSEKKRAYDGWADLSVDSPISANYAFFGALRKISNK